MSGEDAVEKRPHRARDFFRSAQARPEIPDSAATPERLEEVHQAIYLLFNEGYLGSHRDHAVRVRWAWRGVGGRRGTLIVGNRNAGDLFHRARL